MHLNRLRTLIRVVDCASFSGAARSLNLTQPAVSQQIKALEDALGTTLLVRGADRVRPTTSGKLVYEQARRIVSLWDDVVRQVQVTGADNEAAELIVGSSTVPATYWLSQVMYRFRHVRPSTEVTVQVGDSAKVWEWVRDDLVDVGITGIFRSGMSDIDHHPLLRDTITLIAPCAHPWAGRTVSPVELRTAPFLWRASGSGTRQAMEDAFIRWGIDPTSVPRAGELGSTEAVVSAVEAGLGLSFVSSLAVRPALALQRICAVEVESPPIERQFYLIHKSAKVGDPLLASFVACACDEEHFVS